MKKITVEFIRLGIILFAFVFIMGLLFTYINQIDSDSIQFLGELLTIPIMLLTAIVPLWMVYDLVKKQVEDKAIFNLTFFVSIMNLFLFGFAFIYLD